MRAVMRNFFSFVMGLHEHLVKKANSMEIVQGKYQDVVVVVVAVVVVPHLWSVSPYGHSQSTGTKQNSGGKVLNTGCGNPLKLSVISKTFPEQTKRKTTM